MAVEFTLICDGCQRFIHRTLDGVRALRSQARRGQGAARFGDRDLCSYCGHQATAGARKPAR